MRINLPAAIVGFAWLASCGDGAPAPRAPAPFATRMGAPGTTAAAPGGAMPTPPADPAGLSTESSDATWMQCGSLEFPKPAAWSWVKPTAPFRTLQYRVPGETDLIVSVFPAGDGGALQANIDRWANQFGGPAAVKARAERSIGEVRVARIDFEGDYKGMGMPAAQPGMAQLGAIVQGPRQSVFIRLLGTKAAVEAARVPFESLVDGVRPQSAP